MSKLLSAIRAQLRTVAIWVVVIAVIFAIVSYSKSQRAKTTAQLASADQSVRDAIVLDLAQHDRLADALADTANPNEDSKSVQNTLSLTIRQNAADSVNRLVAEKKLDTADALQTLFQFGKDTGKDIKGKASDGLSAIGKADEANLQPIADRLKDGDPDIRAIAADSLGKISGDKAAKLVDMMLVDPAARDASQSALTKIGAPSIPYLVAHLDDADPIFRQKIVGVLGDIAKPAAIPNLNQVAAKDTPPIRRVALVSINKIVKATYDTIKKIADDTEKAKAAGKPLDAAEPALPSAEDMALIKSAEPTLIGALTSPTDDSDARSQSALTLGRMGGPEAVKALVSELGDYDTRIAQSALVGIQSTGAIAVPSLTAILNNPQSVASTRAAAAEALGGIGTGPAINALSVAFANPATPTEIRRSAALGLGRSGNKAAIPILVKALGDKDGEVATSASQALLNPDLEKTAIASLIAGFQQPATSPVPFNASQTLSHMGDLAVPELKLALASPNPQTQTWAAITLGQTDSKDPTVLSALTPLSQSSDAHVKFAASEALERLSGS